MLSNDYNPKIINNKVNKEYSSEISILTNEILNKINYYEEKNNDNKKYLKNIFFSIIIILILILLFYCPFSNNYYKIKLKTEIIKIEEYFKICDDGILLNKKKFKKKEKPKISIISAVYNKQKYILRFLRSIQNQNYGQIEIILIDDFSEDNTVNIIKKCQKEDNRIILIKHKKNKGTLISRNEGIIISRGKYILIPDPDDILSNDILKQCLKKAEESKYDMIRFITYLNNKDFFIYNQINKYLINKSIYQPELSSYIFYGIGYLKIIDSMISNKFVKRNILINALNLLNEYFLNQNMIFYEDTIINFLLYKTSKSCYYLNNVGYFYFSNTNSSTVNYNKNEININKILKSFFLFLKFIFEYTKNCKYEKDMANEIIKKEKEILLSFKMYNKINQNFKFYENIINLYLNNKFIYYSGKKRLNNIKIMLKEKEKKFYKK